MQTLTKTIKDQILIIEMYEFTIPFLKDLISVLDESRTDENISAIILTGNKLFSTGGDVFGMKKAIEEENISDMIYQVISNAAKVILGIISHPLPVIAAINRAAAGAGLSLAMACDHRIASTKTKLSPAFGTLALIPDSGASVLFPLRFGTSITLLNTSSGDLIPLQHALSTGALDQLVKSDELLNTAMQYARKYIAADRLAVAITKELINRKLKLQLIDQFPMEEKMMQEMSKRETFKNRVIDLITKLESKR